MKNIKRSYKTNWAFPWTFCTVTASLGRMCFFMAFQQQSMLTTIHEPLSNIFVWKFSLAYLFIPDIHAGQLLVPHNFKCSYFQTSQTNQCCVANIHFCPAMKAVHILFDFVSTSLTLKHAEGQELG